MVRLFNNLDNIIQMSSRSPFREKMYALYQINRLHLVALVDHCQ